MFNIKKKIVTCTLTFMMVLCLIPTKNVHAANSSAKSSLKKTIVIDAGHNYGGDSGALSIINGVTYKEVELNMQVASKLKTELENRGYNVRMTRNKGEKKLSNEIQSIANRINIANNAQADLFVSIHHNAAKGMPSVSGVETYYSSKGANSNKLKTSKNMATTINNNIAKKFDLNNRGAKDSSLFIRRTSMPSIIVEAGFITNEKDAKRCSNASNQQKEAEIIADAIKANI